MKTAKIENWLMKRLLQWVEKAYRRGYQHGVLAGENGVKHDSKEVMNYRYPKSEINFATFAIVYNDEVFEKKCGVSLEEKHLISCGDGIPKITTTKKGKDYILTTKN